MPFTFNLKKTEQLLKRKLHVFFVILNVIWKTLNFAFDKYVLNSQLVDLPVYYGRTLTYMTIILLCL